MTFCDKCGSENDEDGLECIFCGFSLIQSSKDGPNKIKEKKSNTHLKKKE